MRPQRKIELLAPAKNYEVGVAAINCGADAVYIGAPKFGARQAAGNSIEDIARLVTYAHRYYAKVYVALNTILTDEELREAECLIYELCDANVDALIVQDMGILELNLPPIPLHASTQCNNRTVEKVQFLEQCGFEQVVLARELSLEQIKSIAENTDVALECFVHGALCVSYSGQCYLSEALRQRSANRGACAQMCRLPYTLLDADGNVLSQDKHLLSLKDFDASSHLSEMVDCGVSSFKIEGRLKDENYVKNITAFYRKKLDAILENGGRKASSGHTTFCFTPNPQKTFYRGATDYFLSERKSDIVSLDTPKSVGEPVGRIARVADDSIFVESDAKFNNGDGLCCKTKTGEFVGFRVNRVENNRLFVPRMPAITRGLQLFRNVDVEFEKLLENNCSERKIGLKIGVKQTRKLQFEVEDSDGNKAQVEIENQFDLAKNAEKSLENMQTQFSKLGSTIFYLCEFDYACSDVYFIPNSQLAEIRRSLIEKLEIERARNYPLQRKVVEKTTHKYPQTELDYRANAYNQRAVDFYARHGAKVLQPAFEQEFVPNAELMRTKHCLRYCFGWCPKQHPENAPHEPLILKCGSADLELSFDCKNCEMIIRKK